MMPGCYKNRFLIVWLLIPVILSFGCMFDTRDPEPPTNEQLPWVPPTDSPLTVLQNLANVIVKHENHFDYMRSFADDFIFVPSDNDLTNFEETFAHPWTYQREAQFCSNLFNALATANTITIEFDRADTEDIISDIEETAILYRQYTLDIPPASSGLPGNLTIGLARIKLRISSEGYWVIYRWEDVKFNENYPDWGELRHHFR